MDAMPAKAFKDTTNHDLPKGWQFKALSDLGHWIGGGTPSKENPLFWHNGTVPWVSPKDMKGVTIKDSMDKITVEAVEKSATNMVPAQSVLMVIRSGILRHTFPVAVNEIPVTLNQDMKALCPTSGIDARYVRWFLRSRNREILETCAKDGTTVQSIETSRLHAFNVPIPPIRVQEQIVSKIDELFSDIDAGTAALKRTAALIQRYRQSVLKAAVTGELTRDWREANHERFETGKIETGDRHLARILKVRREAWETAELEKMVAKDCHSSNDKWKRQYTAPLEIDSGGLPNLPEGWVWASIGQIGEVSGGLTKNAKRMELPIARPYLRVANVYENRLELDDVAEIGVRKSELERVTLQTDDLLVVEGNGSIDQIGRVALWDGSIPGCLHQNHIIKVRFCDPLVAWFVLIWCMSPLGRQYIRRVASSSSGLHTLSISKIESLPVPVPNVDELPLIRDLFESAASIIDGAKTDVQQNLKISSVLRQSILKAAFSGKLVRTE